MSVLGWAALVVAVFLAAVVVYDLTQTRRAILRNFPIIGHFRYWIEKIGPELRQYIVAGNDEERPFSRDQRRWVYASAKKENNYFGFGTDNDLERSSNYLIVKHATFPRPDPVDDPAHMVPCAKVWGEARQRRLAFRPASVVYVSAMSYGSLSPNAIEALNRGVKIAHALHNTGEGGISPWHGKGGDLIYQLGTGYFGARTPDGRFDLEALKAQAVVARGQFIAKLGLKHRDDPFMLCNRWHCQAHGGQGRATPGTSAAVRATRGEVLASARGGLVDTVYHSACGGQTEGWDQSWGGEPRAGLGGVDDRPSLGEGPANARDAGSLLREGSPEAWCAASGRRAGVYRWSTRLPGAMLTRSAARLGALGPVTEVRVTRRGRTGRVLTLEVIGTRGRQSVDGESAIRRLLGGVKSALFVITREGGSPQVEPERWVIRGGGYGHGIGLCQHGAIGMATAGRPYKQILQHYFPGTHVERAW